MQPKRCDGQSLALRTIALEILISSVRFLDQTPTFRLTRFIDANIKPSKKKRLFLDSFLLIFTRI